MKYKAVISILLTALFLFSGCGEYQKLLKSRDPELKYEKAVDYFNQGQYAKAQTLLDDVSSYYKGTDRAQDVLIYLARSNMGMKSYVSAANYYEAYIRNYPKGRYCIESRFQVGRCYYLDAPDARLDQEETNKAIEYYQTFVEMYPESPYAEQAYTEMGELYDKLAYKEYLNAKLYYNLGGYLGNNYLSAEITAMNALKKYPSNSYQEELNWIVFAAKYQQMINSVPGKLKDRATEADDEYYSFTTQFPNSKHIKEAEKMKKEIQKRIK